MTRDEIVALQAANRAFAATDIGKLFLRFEHALIKYWEVDSSETISDKRLRELSEASDAARKEFLTALTALMAKEVADA